jgi:hypothetical protein
MPTQAKKDQISSSPFLSAHGDCQNPVTDAAGK